MSDLEWNKEKDEFIDHDDNRETLNTLTRTIQKDNARWQAEARNKQKAETIKAACERQGIDENDFRAYIQRHPNAGQRVEQETVNRLAAESKREAALLSGKADHGQWHREVKGSGFTQQRQVKYSPNEDVRKRAASGDQTAFNDMVDDIIKGL